MVISQIFYQIINLCIFNIAQFVWLQFMSRAVGKKCSFSSDARMEGMWIYYTMSEKWTFIFRRFSEKAMAPHSSTLAWKIPWMEEPGGLQSMGSLRVGHDWVTLLSLFIFMHWRRKWQPTPVFWPRESQGRGAWWAAISGVAQSQTWLKWLSSSSSSWFIMLC